MSSPLISCQNLSKSFGGRNLFNNLNFGLFEKDKVGLIGPNGAGKSTLIKIILKMMDPDQGTVIHRNGLQFSYLEQTPTFNNELSWQDNILSVADDYTVAFEWISKLELSDLNPEKKITEFSGGFQKRIALARELSKNPNFLFLDEPTNHLDVDSIIWLEDFLSEFNIPFLMITHDRLFLERTCTRIMDLDPKNPNLLLITEADLATHLENKQLLLDQQKSTLEKKKNTMRRETEWLRRGAQARQTKQKARIQNAHALGGEVSDLREKTNHKELKFDFGDQQKGPKKLIELNDVSFSYDGERFLWNHFEYLVSAKTRLGLMGANGSGKSTLLKLLTENLKPTSGSIKFTDKIRVSYFEQSKDTLDPQKSLMKNVCAEGDYVHFQGEYIFAKSYLEKFGFSYQQMDLPVEKLSGGEKSKLRLAQIMLTESQLLILDEPTNDLDLESLESLESAIDSYPGAVIVVTHDRFFMDQVAGQILYLDKNQEHHFFAEYFQWESWYNDQKLLEKQVGSKGNTKLDESNSKNNSSGNKKSKGLSYKEKIEFENMEKNILTLEQYLAQTQKDIDDPNNQADSLKINDLYIKLKELEQQIASQYERWGLLEEKNKT